MHHLHGILYCFADLLPRWRLGAEYLRAATFNVLQYVAVKVFLYVCMYVCMYVCVCVCLYC